MIYRMLPGGSRILCIILDVLTGLDVFCTDPAQHLTAADDLDRDLFNVLSSVF